MTDENEPPPLFKTWPRFYTIVIVNEVLLILLFLLFSANYR